MLKRIVAFMTAIVLMCSIMPNVALALTADDTNSFSITNATVTVDGSEDKPVDIVFAGTEDDTYARFQGAFATADSSGKITLANMTAGYPTDLSSYVTVNTGAFKFINEDTGLEANANAALVTATYTVPKDTPTGEYTVTMQLSTSTNFDDEQVKNATYTATINVTNTAGGNDGDEGTTSAYTAALNSTTTDVSVGQTVTVNVAVASTTDAAFNAAEIKLSYPADKLTPVAPSYEHKIADGTLTFEDFGDDKNFGTSAYTVQFNAIADGIAEVTLTNAAFVNKANANKTDLISADIAAEDATVEIEISKKTYDVTLPKDTDDNVIVEGETTVTDGENYTFTLPDTDKYVYDVGEMVVTVGGTPVTPSKEGESYTITDVTGPVVITGISREYRSYNVTFAGNAADEVTAGANTATYNTDYTFTKPSAENFNYTVSITIGKTAYTAFSEVNNVITIPGDVILGDIEITVEKVQTKFTVTVEKDEGIEATWNPAVVDEGDDVVLTITRVAGYTYKVTATMGGTNVEVQDNQDGTYTVKNVTGNIVFKVEVILNVGGIAVQQYLTLDGSIMWLVTNENTMDEGKVPAYNGEAMFWSEKYNAYCYLVVAETLELGSLEDEIGTDALDMISIIDGTAKNVDYGMDVNKSDKVDAADAQFTYNMYNSPYYTGFDADNTVEKFLRADVNGDKNVNVNDADAIIADILS